MRDLFRNKEWGTIIAIAMVTWNLGWMVAGIVCENWTSVVSTITQGFLWGLIGMLTNLNHRLMRYQKIDNELIIKMSRELTEIFTIKKEDK